MIMIYICRNPVVVKSFDKILPPFAFFHKQEFELTLRKTYLQCRHVEIIRKKFNSVPALKAYVRANRYTPERNNQKPSSLKNSLVYTAFISGLCRTCSTHRFLGIRGEQVMVIYGIPSQPGPVQENTGIDIRRLPASEISDLEKGIPLKDDKEKLQIIEGLKGLFSN